MDEVIHPLRPEKSALWCLGPHQAEQVKAVRRGYEGVIQALSIPGTTAKGRGLWLHLKYPPPPQLQAWAHEISSTSTPFSSLPAQISLGPLVIMPISQESHLIIPLLLPKALEMTGCRLVPPTPPLGAQEPSQPHTASSFCDCQKDQSWGRQVPMSSCSTRLILPYLGKSKDLEATLGLDSDTRPSTTQLWLQTSRSVLSLGFLFWKAKSPTFLYSPLPATITTTPTKRTKLGQCSMAQQVGAVHTHACLGLHTMNWSTLLGGAHQGGGLHTWPCRPLRFVFL